MYLFENSPTVDTTACILFPVVHSKFKVFVRRHSRSVVLKLYKHTPNPYVVVQDLVETHFFPK